MLGTSALYHRGNWAPARHRRLQRLDHNINFLLIAGTATPAFLIAVHGDARVVGLIAVWALTLIAATLRMAKMNVPELVAGGIFVGLGWAAGLALPGCGWIPGPRRSADARRGLLYTAGALSYHRRWPNPSPADFRLPRGLSLFRRRRGGVSVDGDSAVHRLKLPRLARCGASSQTLKPATATPAHSLHSFIPNVRGRLYQPQWTNHRPADPLRPVVPKPSPDRWLRAVEIYLHDVHGGFRPLRELGQFLLGDAFAATNVSLAEIRRAGSTACAQGHRVTAGRRCQAVATPARRGASRAGGRCRARRG